MRRPLTRRQILGCGVSLPLWTPFGRASAHTLRSWRRLSDLPMPLGGQFAGVHGGALIVAGGSWFPISKWAGGTKRWVDTIFVLEDPRSGWKRFSLPRPLAYGGSVSHSRGLLLIGGGDAEHNFADCHWLRWNGRSVEVEAAPRLLKPLANCGAAVLGDRAFVVGGQVSPIATAAERAMYSLDLTRPRAVWKTEAPLPGPGRILPSVAAAAGALYVAGGADLFADERGAPARVYLQDSWIFRPGASWTRGADLPERTCAAPAWAVSDSFLVLGGSDGVLAPREMELGDKHPGFSRGLKIYSRRDDAWRTSEQLPFSLVTTTATVWNGLLVIPGGEDRPAHRSAAVHALPLKEITG